MDEQDNETIKDLSERSVEMKRLKTLSDIELIKLCLASEAFEYAIVRELMNRLKPNWLEEL